MERCFVPAVQYDRRRVHSEYGALVPVQYICRLSSPPNARIHIAAYRLQSSPAPGPDVIPHSFLDTQSLIHSFGEERTQFSRASECRGLLSVLCCVVHVNIRRRSRKKLAHRRAFCSASRASETSTRERKHRDSETPALYSASVTSDQ